MMSDSADWCCEGHCGGRCGGRLYPTDIIDIIKSQVVDIPSLCELQPYVDVLDHLVDELTSEEEQWPDVHLHRQLCSCVAHCLKLPGMEKPLEVPAEGLDMIFCMLEVLIMSTEPMDEEKAPMPELLRRYDSEIMEALGSAAANFTAAHKQLYKPQKDNKHNKMMKLETSSEYPNGDILEVGGQLSHLYERLCKIYPEGLVSESAAAIAEAMDALYDAVDATAEAHMELQP